MKTIRCLPAGATAPVDRGAKWIVVDPRFTRTASQADMYAPIRPGTDIAFFGGMIHYILEKKLYQKEYVMNYTNATFLIDPSYKFDDCRRSLLRLG